MTHDDQLEQRLARMARAAGYALVPLLDNRQALNDSDAISVVCIAEARRMRQALVEVRELLREGWDGLARQTIADALDAGQVLVIPPGDLIVDHSPQANT